MRAVRHIMLAAALTLTPQVAVADVVEQVVEQLQAQGYSEVTVERTLLGRARIEARSSGRYREIVVNPRNGVILRDFWEQDGQRGTLIGGGPPPTAPTGDDRDNVRDDDFDSDDVDRDDRDEDDERDDTGSDSSGSGGGDDDDGDEDDDDDDDNDND